jgi:phytoene/squalene synthetase
VSVPASEAIEHFVAKWHRREPEMALAEAFCPPGQRPRFRAWGALVHELREAAFELSDARVTAVKCQWWAEELANLPQGRGRHPISTVIDAPGLPWTRLARALIEQSQLDARPGDADAALAHMQPLAAALTDIESALFGVDAAAEARPLAVHLLLQRLPQGLAAEDQARLPLNLLARHGVTVAQVAAGEGAPLLQDWARQLLAALPAAHAPAPLFRRLRTGFDRARLARLAAGRGFAPPPAPASVWRAWRIARGA